MLKIRKYNLLTLIIVIFIISFLSLLIKYHLKNYEKNKLKNVNEFVYDNHKNYDFNTIDNDFVSSKDKHSVYALDSSLNLTAFSTTHINDSDIDLVLIWNKYFGNDFLYESVLDADRHLYDSKEIIHHPAYCEKLYPNCRITNHRYFIKRANMIVFHWTDFNLNQVPRYRSPEQIWLLFSHESPKFTPKLPNTIHITFNATSSYYSKSDVPIPYGETERFNNPNYKPNIDKKTSPIVWLVSHCNVPSRRDEYVKLLGRHIHVDVYGACSKGRHCNKLNWDYCQSVLYSKYYFYLSFENSLCDEYVTEKLFLALQHEIVPIVYGGANYTAILPPHSFIDATKYRPIDLAKILKNLISNRDEYLKYFEWKKHYKIQGDRHANDHMICEACRYVQRYKNKQIERKSKTLEQINRFWIKKCWNEKKIDEMFKNY